MRKVSPVARNEKKAEFVKLITELGPHIDLIGRRIGTHKETVRYWYKQLLDRGFTVRATYNYEKLGLRRLVFLVDIDESYAEYVQPLFLAMNQLCYVASYRRTIPNGLYLVSASVPSEAAEDYIDFMNQLKAKGIFKSVEAYRCDWIRNIPMKAIYYDFDEHVWDFDWASSQASTLDPSKPFSSKKASFDSIDLHILQELYRDANLELTEIQGNLKKNYNLEVDYKTLAYHYRVHVIQRGLIKAYPLNWMGTRYDFQSEKPVHRRHRYVAVDVLVKNVTEAERMGLIQEFSRVPFQWAEAAGADYFTQFVFPTEMVTEGLLYLEKAMAGLRGRASFHTIDMAESLTFTVEPALWDPQKKAWRFEKEALLEKFEALKVKIKSGLS